MISHLLRFLIRTYQIAVSPLLPRCCRFYPSCSQYALDAIRFHGAFRGTFLAAKRILRCSSLDDGGIDFVPSPQNKEKF